MPELIDVIRTRRSIRKYTSEPIDPESRALIEEALLRSPSSMSRNPWSFVFVEDKKSLERLSRAKPHGASFVKNAALAIVVLADPSTCDVWVEDCSIATMLVHLQAHALGLGSCWVQIRKRPHDDEQNAEAYVREVVGAPDTLRVLSLVAIGHPAEAKPGHDQEGLPWDRIQRSMQVVAD